MIKDMLADIAQGYTLTVTYSGERTYTVSSTPSGSIYTGVTLDELAQVYRLRSDRLTVQDMPLDWPNGVPSERD